MVRTNQQLAVLSMIEARPQGVVLRIVSCDPDRVAPGTEPVRLSRTFVGTQGCVRRGTALPIALSGTPFRLHR